MQQFDYEQFKRRLNKKVNFPISVLLVLIILLTFTLTILTNNQKNSTIYFVEVGNYQNYKFAKTKVSELEKQNIGCYIFYEQTYHVFVGFNSSKKSAKLLLEKLKQNNTNPTIYEIKFKNFSALSILNKNENRVIKNLFNSVEKILEFLSSWENSTENVKEIKKLSTNFETNFEEFKTAFKSNKNYNIPKKYLNKILLSLKDLSSGELEQANFNKTICDIAIQSYYFSLCF